MLHEESMGKVQLVSTNTINVVQKGHPDALKMSLLSSIPHGHLS